MYQTHKTYIKPDQKMSDLIMDNPFLLLMLEHFEIDFVVQDKTVAQICLENNLNPALFTGIANLYNGFIPEPDAAYTLDDISSIIKFLKSSHTYYKNDKYPEIRALIAKLSESSHRDEIIMIERFFDVYFEEVIEHLNYEDLIAFPYFCGLISKEGLDKAHPFSLRDYSDHHTDIETKLSDLKNLLLKHISFQGNLSLRRKLFFSLFELEYDLKIHSSIEEYILIPLMGTIEKEGK